MYTDQNFTNIVPTLTLLMKNSTTHK